VLYYESDGDLLLVSRNRKQLGEVFQFVLPDQMLVEDLVDKERFQELAQRLNLPVPAARRLHPRGDVEVEKLGLQYPVVIKPLTRRPEIWRAVAPEGKALRISSAAEFTRILPTLADSGVAVLAQELIEGPETRIESYHVYVDDQGEIVGEFTGRKIRTYPVEYGESTALVTTDAPDVVSLGRELVDRIGITGVAKFDFKRAADDRLFLLEINPRFNLWHHLGSLAGVNLPALVYGDLTGRTRSSRLRARPGLSWCRLWQDVQAAKASRIPLRKWLPWALRCDAKRLLTWDDPKPFILAGLWRLGFAIRGKMQKFSYQLTLPSLGALGLHSDANAAELILMW
jgi:predicted ATP-grasp superfamily ATP-dependent carboligase